MEQDETTNVKHHGNQVGIAAVGLSLCAACGVAWLAGNGDPSTDTTLTYSPSSHEMTPADVPVATAPEVSTGDVTTPTAPAVRPSPADDDIVTTASAQRGEPFTIIVRFEGEPVLEEIGKTFRKDPEGSQAKFRSWAADKPALAGLVLDRASYSGELVLTGSGSRSMKDTIAAIEAMDNVAYVEPDYSAKASKEG